MLATVFAVTMNLANNSTGEGPNKGGCAKFGGYMNDGSKCIGLKNIYGKNTSVQKLFAGNGKKIIHSLIYLHHMILEL